MSTTLETQLRLSCDECNEFMRPQTAREVVPSIDSDEPMEFQTLVGYFSPEGHTHDDNCLSRVYICPNGHERKVSKRRTCPACDWVGRETCFCHADKKVKEWPA